MQFGRRQRKMRTGQSDQFQIEILLKRESHFDRFQKNIWERVPAYGDRFKAKLRKTKLLLRKASGVG